MEHYVSNNHYKHISNQGYVCRIIRYMMIMVCSLGALPLYAQNPSAEIFVDQSDRNYPLRLTIATNARRDIASITVRATEPTNIVAFDADTSKYLFYPIGETGMGVSAANDTNFLPTGSNITIARFLTDSVTRQQNFTIDFLNRNGESVATQFIRVTIPISVTLASPCNRQVIDLTTGLTAGSMQLGIGSTDNLWSMLSGNNIGLPSSSTNSVYAIAPHPLWDATTNARWLNYSNSLGLPNGSNTYWRQFCVGRDSVRVRIALLFESDDLGEAFLVRPNATETFIGVSGGFTGPPSTPAVTLTLNSGVHYIRVRNDNIGGGPTAFRFMPGSAITVLNIGAGALGLTGSACCKAPGRVVGRKMWDKNCNGKIDAGDSPLSGWVITATPTGGGTPITATTNSAGNYTLQLFEGTYTVTETLQSGWSPSVSAGPYTVTVLSGQSVIRNFLNCKQPTCEELFTVGESDSVCCTGRFSLSNAGNTVVTSLSFVATGGVVIGVNTGCLATTSPNLTAGLTSGTFTFNPGCANMAVQFDAKSTTATGKICIKWTATFKQGTQTFTCTKEICLNCIRMPKDCRMPLQVTPDVFPPINTDSRTFTISNVKLPASQISSVDILFVNEPTPAHIGGGLFVDATPRNWTFANSLGYNRVRMNCTGTANPHGASANNWVKFNLGVDNTINYSGVILVKIGYCDGDTCFAEYQWKAKNIKNLPNSIDTAIAVRNPRLLRFKVISPDSTRSIGMKVGDSLATIRAVTAPCGSLDNDCPDIPKQFRAATKGNTAHLTFGAGECNPDPTCYCCPPEDFTITVVFTPGNDNTNPKVPIKIMYFDKNAVEIGQAERELTSKPTSVVNSDNGNASSNDIRIKSIAPNPSNENSVVRFALDESSSSVNITLVDIQGRVLSALVNNQRMDAGEHTIPFNTSSLTNGVYLLRITAEGIVVTSKFTIVR